MSGRFCWSRGDCLLLCLAACFCVRICLGRTGRTGGGEAAASAYVLGEVLRGKLVGEVVIPISVSKLEVGEALPRSDG